MDWVEIGSGWIGLDWVGGGLAELDGVWLVWVGLELSWIGLE